VRGTPDVAVVTLAVRASIGMLRAGGAL